MKKGCVERCNSWLNKYSWVRYIATLTFTIIFVLIISGTWALSQPWSLLVGWLALTAATAFAITQAFGHQLKMWVKSFQDWKQKHAYVYFIDAIFALVVYYSLTWLTNYSQSTLRSLPNPYATNAPSVANAAITAVATKLVISILIFLLIFFIVHALTRAAIWIILTKKKASHKQLLMFTIKNAGWVLAWTVLGLILTFGVKSQLAAAMVIITIITYLYATPYFHKGILYGHGWNSTKKALSTIHHKLPSLLFAVLVLSVWASTFQYLLYRLGQVSDLVVILMYTAVVLAPFFVWYRKYMLILEE